MPGTVQISIHSGFINPAIYYTLGGSQPSFDSHLYSGPFSISATAIVRAIAYRSDFLDSQESDPITIIIPRSFELLATTDGGGAVTTTPPNAGSRYLSNAAVSIAATPTAPWVFLGWGGDASGNNNPLSINMRADTYVKAIFGTTVGTTTARSGVISISPALPAYPFATVVTLTALPSLGNYFGAWGNAASGNTNPFVFTVRTPAPTISALFSALSAGQYGLVILGAIVGVEFAAPPMGGWKIDAKGGPHLRVAAVIHKQAEGVPKLLGEHLSGRHKYAVSQEVLYSMLDSGFVVETGVGGGTTATRELCARTTPEEFTRAGLSYVPVLLGADQLCPEELLNCYSFEQSRVTRDWQGQRVTVLKGGIAGRVHFQGVGLVRYGAEKEAQIQQILASDPDGLEAGADPELAAVLQIVAESSRNLLTAVWGTVLPGHVNGK